MTTRTFYEAIGHEAIDWEPYFLPISQRPQWTKGAGIAGLGNWQKPCRPLTQNQQAIRKAHEEGREFPVDSELMTSKLRDNEYLQCMRLWIQLHYMTDNGRIPRKLPGSPPPYGPERILRPYPPSVSQRVPGPAPRRDTQRVQSRLNDRSVDRAVGKNTTVQRKTSIQTRFAPQQSRGPAHPAPEEMDGEPQPPMMTQMAPVTNPHKNDEGDSPRFGHPVLKPWGDKSEILSSSRREVDVWSEISYADAFDDALLVQNLWGASPRPLRNNTELLLTPQSPEVTQKTPLTNPPKNGKGNSPEIGLASPKPWGDKSEVLPFSPREHDALL